MGFLFDKLKPKKEIAKLENFDASTICYRPFALLQEAQLEAFVRGSLKGFDSLYDTLYKKTGNSSLTETPKGNMYKTKKGFKEYTYLAALESLLCGMFGWGNDIPCSYLDYGQGKFFDERGFIVSYSKTEPLYERTNSRSKDGSYYTEAGIIQVSYQSPIGNFVINQNQVNNRIFEVYVSEDMSEMLLNRLTSALEISLELKSGSVRDDFNKKYRVTIDNPNPNVALQRESDTMVPSVNETIGKDLDK